MAIYAFGAYYEFDMSEQFKSKGIVGVGWEELDAPDLHCFVLELKVGDIVYIKAFPPSSSNIIVKGIGIIANSVIRTTKDTEGTVAIGRNVSWIVTDHFEIPKPNGKDNVRTNTIYEEFHPVVQTAIISNIINRQIQKLCASCA